MGQKTYPPDFKFYHALGYPDYDTFFAAVRKEVFDDYLAHLAPKLRPVAAEDSVKRFCHLCGAWPQYLNVRGLFLPEIIVSLVCHNALRCTRVVLQGTAPQLSHYNVDLNVPHLYGYAPLHVAAEAFNVNMIQLLLRHGASANVRTKGSKVIEGLLPLHACPSVNFAAGCSEAAPGCVNTSSRKVSLSGFDDVKSRIDAATRALHCEEFAMIKDGKNGRALKNLKHKKQIILTAHVIVGIANVAGEALEKYIQTHSEVPHDKIVEHVSSILNANGIVTYGKGVDIGNLECYQYPWQTLIDKSNLQRGATNEADNSSSLKAECKVKASLKGVSMDHARNKFFPFWKSVLSTRFQVQLAPPNKPSLKNTTSTKPSKDTASTKQSKGIGNAEHQVPTTIPPGFKARLSQKSMVVFEKDKVALDRRMGSVLSPGCLSGAENPSTAGPDAKRPPAYLQWIFARVFYRLESLSAPVAAAAADPINTSSRRLLRLSCGAQQRHASVHFH
ncbi:hypothetical protein PR202_gb08916 [Eleusine coracana subsp. coracana]|uniref:Uncharacterized protein n=1 Tax=Eleusine coracana subsp. coracana TaxID=191504 RepID=A0AAV5EGF4_ELECO|nr:hypothetical protein PR202_gb08916 [Eleusine coracana subsp. coracana]